MSARRKSKRGRKRKQPDAFNDNQTSQPRSKKRKLSHTHHKRATNTKAKPKTDDKSLSTSPKKISKKITKKNTSNPFKNTHIPTVTFHKPNKPKPTRRPTQYQYTHIQNQDNSSSNDDDDQDDDLTSPESTSPYHAIHRIPLKHSTIRSQPSTPMRKISTDKKPEPLSQSAKRSKTHCYIKHTSTNCIPIHMNMNMNMNTRDSSLTPPPPIGCGRKSVPGLFSSQESLGFSPSQTHMSPVKRNFKTCVVSPKGIMHVIPVNATPIRSTITRVGEDNSDDDNGDGVHVQSVISDDIGEVEGNNEPPHENGGGNGNDGRSTNIFYILLFALIGFMVGFIVAFSVYHENELRPNPKANDVINIDPCTTRFCTPCMDQYWTLKSQCDERDRLRLKSEKQRLENNKQKELCDLKLNEIESGNIKCRAEKIKLNKKITDLKATVRYVRNCNEYLAKVGELEHELGECNVEWGSCEQLGRQKDKLDEKRLEEIEKQKTKFSMCNSQLKRYKDKAKKNKGY